MLKFVHFYSYLDAFFRSQHKTEINPYRDTTVLCEPIFISSLYENWNVRSENVCGEINGRASFLNVLLESTAQSSFKVTLGYVCVSEGGVIPPRIVWEGVFHSASHFINFFCRFSAIRF